MHWRIPGNTTATCFIFVTNKGRQETFTGVIEIGHLSHIMVKKMVHFFYNVDYHDELPEGVDISPLQLHARMFALADQYELLV